MPWVVFRKSEQLLSAIHFSVYNWSAKQPGFSPGILMRYVPVIQMTGALVLCQTAENENAI